MTDVLLVGAESLPEHFFGEEKLLNQIFKDL